MMELIRILKDYSGKVLMDEDGYELRMELSEGISSEVLEEFERLHCVSLPDDFKQFLQFSNGIKMFGIAIHSLEKMDFFSDSELLCFHGWGNGDFDLVSLSHKNHYGAVLFSNHSIDNLFFISNSFIDWVLNVIKEIEEKRALFHPGDYLNQEVKGGMYKNVLAKFG